QQEVEDHTITHQEETRNPSDLGHHAADSLGGEAELRNLAAEHDPNAQQVVVENGMRAFAGERGDIETGVAVQAKDPEDTRDAGERDAESTRAIARDLKGAPEHVVERVNEVADHVEETQREGLADVAVGEAGPKSEGRDDSRPAGRDTDVDARNADKGQV